MIIIILIGQAIRVLALIAGLLLLIVMQGIQDMLQGTQGDLTAKLAFLFPWNLRAVCQMFFQT
jgi:hypothetical protein